MNINDLKLYSYITEKKFFKLFTTHTTTIFLTHHSIMLFRGIQQFPRLKIFHITDTTAKRLAGVPTEGITGTSVSGLQSSPCSGLVYFNNGLHFLYTIRTNGVYIATSTKRSVKGKAHDDPLWYLQDTLSGFLYYDFYSGEKQCYINNLIDAALHNKDNLLAKEKNIRRDVRKLIQEVDNGDKTTYNIHLDDYIKKYEETRLCLQAFMFIHFAKIINTTRISEQCDTRTFAQKMHKTPIPYVDVIQVDTHYDETLNVINPFSVSGHFRNQPCGKNWSELKMIYIDQFMKTGYTRLATKLKIENQKETHLQ